MDVLGLEMVDTIVGSGFMTLGLDWKGKETPATLRVGVAFLSGLRPGLRAISWETEVVDFWLSLMTMKNS